MMIIAAVNAANLPSDVVMSLGLIAALGLVLLLGVKTILRSEVKHNQKLKQLDKGINVAIIPLVVIFLVLVYYKIFSTV